MSENVLSPQEFDSIYSKVPRLTVEIVIRSDKLGVFLTQRNIEPCKGKWHLPGGTVRYAEPMADAVKRIAKRELGIDALDLNCIGYVEYPSHYNNGLDSPVGIIFEVLSYSGSISLNKESQNGNWFKRMPPGMHEDQDNLLIKNNLLRP